MRPPLVISVCAVPGAGKSTLIERLKRRLACGSVAQDDFAPATRMDFDEIKAWFERGGSYDAFDMSAVVAAVQGALSRQPRAPLLLLETHFGRNHSALAPLIDCQIWIDVPLDIALARQIAVLSEQLRHDDADVGAWLRRYLTFYQDGLHAMYERQRAVMSIVSDVVIDGCQSPAVVADATAAHLATLASLPSALEHPSSPVEIPDA